MSENWTYEELEAAVAAYMDMRSKVLNRIPFKKKNYYVSLSDKYGRTEKSYEYRMQNISYVFSIMGRRWVTGLKPAKNVGARIANEIEQIINNFEGNSPSKVAAFASSVSTFRAKKEKQQPKGNKKPNKSQIQSTQYQRDPEVVAWVLDEAGGVCESCSKPAPFEKDDGTPFLEVHHIRMLSDDGSDTTTNAVAICPNCHREQHYGKNRLENIKVIYSKVGRLIEE
jgi:5-methylcytosine-specific restriction protein A